MVCYAFGRELADTLPPFENLVACIVSTHFGTAKREWVNDYCRGNGSAIRSRYIITITLRNPKSIVVMVIMTAPLTSQLSEFCACKQHETVIQQIFRLNGENSDSNKGRR